MVHLEYSLQCPCKKKTHALSREACKVLMAFARAKAALFAASASTSAVRMPDPSPPLASGGCVPAAAVGLFGGLPPLLGLSRGLPRLLLRRGMGLLLGGLLRGGLLRGLLLGLPRKLPRLRLRLAILLGGVLLGGLLLLNGLPLRLRLRLRLAGLLLGGLLRGGVPLLGLLLPRLRLRLGMGLLLGGLLLAGLLLGELLLAGLPLLGLPRGLPRLLLQRLRELDLPERIGRAHV